MQMDRMLENDSINPIEIELSSYGGETNAGLAYYSKIRNCAVKTEITVYGACQSAATLVCAACDIRKSAPETIFMVHDSTIKIKGTVTQLVKEVKELFQEEQIWTQLLTLRTTLSVKQLRGMHKKTTYFTASQALEYGLIDQIILPKGG